MEKDKIEFFLNEKNKNTDFCEYNAICFY